ncbi:MAG: GNAT family N-acetyltransferase [Acidobacteriota bacterium]
MMPTRAATATDVSALTTLINQAYVVERFFKVGDRISEEGVRALQRTGTFLLLERAGELVGSVYVEIRGTSGYIGLLSVRPGEQGRGYGQALMAAAEAYSGTRGATESELRVVNLREDLPPFYRKLGYVAAGTEPFADPLEATQPCHFVKMIKPLRPAAS